MTVADYNTNLADIFTDGGTGTWDAIGTGGAGLTQETDYFIQGISCMSKSAWAGAVKGMIHDNSGDAGGSGTDGAYIAWMSHTAPNSLADKSAGGMQFLIGSAVGAYEHYYVGGADTLTFLKWALVAVNEATAGDDTTGTPSATVESFFGGLWNLPSGGPTKGAPAVIDGIRFGRCDIIIEFGTGADPEATFAGVLTNLETPSLRYGLLVQREPGGAFENSGLFQFGSSTNAVEFLDADKTIFIRDHEHVTANFNTWEVQHASSIVTFTNLIVKALGTTSPGRWISTDNATLLWVTCSLIDMGVFGFLTNATILGCTFLRCAQITHGGATMNGTSILASTVAADEGALLYDETVDPDGEMDNMSFSMGVNNHHAIRFGTNVTNDITLRGIDFTGFGSGDSANDSVFRFDAGSGSLNLNLVNCVTDGAFSIDSAGIVVTVVIDPVTALVHIDDNEGESLQFVRVLLEAADDTGDFPFDDTITITASGTLATVTHTGHGMKTGDKSVIRFASDNFYNGTFIITVNGDDEYEYTMGGSPSSPATIVAGKAAIKATGAILEGETDVNGDISASRTYTLDTPVTGFARISTSSPRFKSFPLDGNEVDASLGLTINVRLVLDE